MERRAPSDSWVRSPSWVTQLAVMVRSATRLLVTRSTVLASTKSRLAEDCGVSRRDADREIERWRIVPPSARESTAEDKGSRRFESLCCAKTRKEVRRPTYAND